MLVALKVVHIAFAAAWFGHKLLIPRDIDRSLSEQSQADELVRRMRRAERLGIGAGLGTVLTGAGLILLTTGWGDVAVQIWVGLAAAMSMFVVGGLVARPAWSRVQVGVNRHALGEARSGARTFKTTLIAENLLWIVALTAMVI